MRPRLRHAAFVAVTAAMIVGFTATPAAASHSWNGYHWARSGEARLTILSSVTSNWSNALSVANSDWNRSAYLQNTVVASSTTSTARQQCAFPSGAIRVCNFTYGNTGWSGLASIRVTSGNHITTGTAKMNDTFLASADSAKRQGVMCQEVGHDFGLAHQDENFTNPNLGTCMDYTNNWSTNQHPNTHDYNQLAAQYGNHNDSTAASRDTAGITTIVTGDVVTLVTWAS
ncbi:MAG TPA: hypothetical protein VGX25_06680 [Actinophytocola sp.]|uniref:hypothetical protein n=1 Tax=Actinophytocola sp. TaxID=1872138 RepID=UPI002DDD3519|nr:hypothetical protein [Actinophytocola sp.]HEV2779073.1 hypothetical protein [Actinophytocola sp.]